MSQNGEASVTPPDQGVSGNGPVDRVFEHQLDDLIRVVKCDLRPEEIERVIRKLAEDEKIHPGNVQELITERGVGTMIAMRELAVWITKH